MKPSRCRNRFTRTLTGTSAAALFALAGTLPIAVPTWAATNTPAVVASISVGTGPQGIAVTPDGTRAYVANWSTNTVSAIDTATNTVVSVIPVGNRPYGVAIAPNGNKAYVTNNADDSVSVISTSANAVTNTLALSTGASPYGIAIQLNGLIGVIAASGLNRLELFNATLDSATGNTATGQTPIQVAISPSSTYAYTTNNSANTVSMSNISSFVTTSQAVGLNPVAIAVSPEGTFVYATNYGANTVSVIRLSDNSITTITVGTSPNGVAFSPDGTTAYVTNYNSNDVTVIDTASRTVRSTFAVGTNPTGVTFSPDGTRAYVANYTSNTISVIDTGATHVVGDPSTWLLKRQGLPMPLAGSCNDLDDAAYSYGTGLSGGWRRGWEPWVNTIVGSDGNRIGGWACIRTLINTGGQSWSVADH